MTPWDADLERECTALVVAICSTSSSKAEIDRAWRELLTRVAPHIEGWARANPLLRRCRLNGDDDVRGLLIAVMTKLSQRDHENLRSFLAREDDGGGDTPLRGWLLGLVRFAAQDHVKHRLGWHGPAPEGEAEGRQGSKRDLGTDAARFDDLVEQGLRPPMTDMLTRQRLLDEVRAHAATFPPAMQSALEDWLTDHSFEEIAEKLELAGGPDEARALVRSAQARLRERLRG